MFHAQNTRCGWPGSTLWVSAHMSTHVYRIKVTRPCTESSVYISRKASNHKKKLSFWGFYSCPFFRLRPISKFPSFPFMSYYRNHSPLSPFIALWGGMTPYQLFGFHSMKALCSPQWSVHSTHIYVHAYMCVCCPVLLFPPKREPSSAHRVSRSRTFRRGI